MSSGNASGSWWGAYGIEEEFFPGGAMEIPASSTAYYWPVQMSGGNVVGAVAFPYAADSYATLKVPLAKRWNGGTVEVTIYGLRQGGSTPFNANFVLKLHAVTPGTDSLNPTFSGDTARNLTLTCTTDEQSYSANTGFVAADGSPAKGDRICIQFMRDVGTDHQGPIYIEEIRVRYTSENNKDD